MIKMVALVEFCPPRLGSDRRIYEMLTRLPRNHEVHFVVFPPSRALLGMIPLPAEHRERKEISLQENVNAHYISLPFFLQKIWRNYFLGYLMTVFCIWPKALKEIRSINPEVIMLNYPSAYTGLVGFSIGKILGRKVVADFNDMIAEYTISLFDNGIKHSGKKANISKGMVSRILTTIQDYIVSRANAVTAVTTQIIEYCRKRNIRQDVYLLPDGVDVSMFDPTNYSGDTTKRIRSMYGIKEYEKVVVYTGRLEEWAGVKTVLSCAERLKDSDIRFLLIGEGSQKGKTQQANVIFSGRIPYEQVPSYLAAADLVLVPMEQNTIGNSASPLKLFEAMAMNKAIIASNTRGIREVMTNNVEGVLLPQDEKEWALAIERILEDSDKASSLGKCARNRIKAEFDWKVLVSRLAKILSPSAGESAKSPN